MIDSWPRPLAPPPPHLPFRGMKAPCFTTTSLPHGAAMPLWHSRSYLREVRPPPLCLPHPSRGREGALPLDRPGHQYVFSSEKLYTVTHKVKWSCEFSLTAARKSTGPERSIIDEA